MWANNNPHLDWQLYVFFFASLFCPLGAPLFRVWREVCLGRGPEMALWFRRRRRRRRAESSTVYASLIASTRQSRVTLLPHTPILAEVDRTGFFCGTAVPIYMVTFFTKYMAIYHIFGHIPYIWPYTKYLVAYHIYGFRTIL